MYLYSVHAMPGQKAKFEGDPSVKYQVKRVNTEIAVSKKGRSEIIRTNLEYEDAIKLTNGFNEKEGKSQAMREEESRRKE